MNLYEVKVFKQFARGGRGGWPSGYITATLPIETFVFGLRVGWAPSG